MNKIWLKVLIELLDKYDSRKKNWNMKSDMSNLKTTITRTKSIVSYEILCLWENFQGTCFRNAFLKTCQYATMDEKVHKGLKYVFIKIAQKGYVKVFHLAQKIKKLKTRME